MTIDDKIAQIKAERAAITDGDWKQSTTGQINCWRTDGEKTVIGSIHGRVNANFVANAPHYVDILLDVISEMEGFDARAVAALEYEGSVLRKKIKELEEYKWKYEELQ